MKQLIDGKMLITIGEAVEVAKKWMKSWDKEAKIPNKVDVKLEKGDYIVSSPTWTVYVCASTGNVMYPNSDIMYDLHLG
jgi:hypothetical protein